MSAVPTSWCDELCQRLRAADYDEAAHLWAVEAFLWGKTSAEPYCDDRALSCLTAEPPNEATLKCVELALLEVLVRDDARTAAWAASALSRAGDPALVPVLTEQLRRRVEEFMAANSAMGQILLALQNCAPNGLTVSPGFCGADPRQTVMDAQTYLKRQGYDYVPW